MEKKIIAFLIFLFVVSSAYLFYVDSRYIDPDYQKDWWALYFNDPKSKSLHFTIENHSSRVDFRWEVSAGGEKIQEAAFVIAKGTKKGFLVNLPENAEEKITITAIAGEEKKEIYKNYSN